MIHHDALVINYETDTLTMKLSCRLTSKKSHAAKKIVSSQDQ